MNGASDGLFSPYRRLPLIAHASLDARDLLHAAGTFLLASNPHPTDNFHTERRPSTPGRWAALGKQLATRTEELRGTVQCVLSRRVAGGGCRREDQRRVVPGAEDGADVPMAGMRCGDEPGNRTMMREMRPGPSRKVHCRIAGRDAARAARSASRFGYPGDGNGVIMGSFGTPSPGARGFGRCWSAGAIHWPAAVSCVLRGCRATVRRSTRSPGRGAADRPIDGYPVRRGPWFGRNPATPGSWSPLSCR